MKSQKRVAEDTCVVVDIYIYIYIFEKKIVSLAVTSEALYDGNRLKKLVNNVSENKDVKRVIAEGSYDIKENFRY